MSGKKGPISDAILLKQNVFTAMNFSLQNVSKGFIYVCVCVCVRERDDKINRLEIAAFRWLSK